MKAIFLSDAHLRQPQDNNYQLLLQFLNQQKDLDGLFLLGDIFEFWLGYEHLVFTPYMPLLESLRKLNENGTRLYFVEGNHDFLLGPYFTETLNCSIVTEQQMVRWDNQSIHICHGDLLNPGIGYRQLRKFWRCRLIQTLAKIVHPDLVWKFAIWLSNKSAKNNPDRPHYNPLPHLRPYADKMAADCDYVVCGHFHFPITEQHNNTQLVALGDWINQFSYAELKDGRMSLKTYHQSS